MQRLKMKLIAVDLKKKTGNRFALKKNSRRRICQRFLASQADDVVFPHVGRRASVVGDFQQRRVDVVAIVVGIVDVDDFDVEHGVGREASGVSFFAVVARVQVGLELLVDAVLVHADGTVRVRAADQRCVRVLRVEACAVGWEFLFV